MPSRHDIIRATVVVVPVFTCADCGARERGDRSHEAVFEGQVPGHHELERLPRSSQDMPVGWASFYAPDGNLYRCPNCITKPAFMAGRARGGLSGA